MDKIVYELVAKKILGIEKFTDNTEVFFSLEYYDWL